MIMLAKIEPAGPGQARPLAAAISTGRAYNRAGGLSIKNRARGLFCMCGRDIRDPNVTPRVLRPGCNGLATSNGGQVGVTSGWRAAAGRSRAARPVSSGRSRPPDRASKRRRGGGSGAPWRGWRTDRSNIAGCWRGAGRPGGRQAGDGIAHGPPFWRPAICLKSSDDGQLPGGEILEQSDATAWMAKYCLNMLEIALVLANHESAYEDIALKFFEHFGAIALAMDELWDEEDGFFYDRLRKPDGKTMVVRARSMVGLLPIFASVRFKASLRQALPTFRARARWFLDNAPQARAFTKLFTHSEPDQLICLVDKPRFKRLFARMLDEQEFLSPFGLRSLSGFHLEDPLLLDLDGAQVVSTMNRRNRRLHSSAAIRTGAARSVSRSIFSRFSRFELSIVVWATISPSNCRLALAGAQTSVPWLTRSSGAYCGSSCPMRRGAPTRARQEPALQARLCMGRPAAVLRLFQR